MSKNTNIRGFTLIEIMIVLTIIGTMAALAPKALFNRSSEFKNEMLKFGPLGQTLRNKARIKNMTYRLVFFVGPAESKSSKDKNPMRPQFWVESSSRAELIPTAEESERYKDEKKSAKEGDETSNHDGFQPDTSIMKKPKTLPDKFTIEEIEYGAREQSVKNGIAYVHFFPSGLVEEAVVHIGNGDSYNWSIYFQPLTGVVDVHSAKQNLKDLRPQ